MTILAVLVLALVVSLILGVLHEEFGIHPGDALILVAVVASVWWAIRHLLAVWGSA